MIDRLMRAAKMDAFLYQEVEKNQELTKEALQAVVLISACAGVSTFISELMTGDIVGGVVGGIVQVIMGIVGYYVWSFAVLIVGTKMLGGTADFGEVSRCIAYAYAPNALRLFGFIPGLGGLLALVGSLWALVLGIVAIRQAMNFTTGPAIATAVIAFIAMVVVLAVLTAVLLVPLGVATMMVTR